MKLSTGKLLEYLLWGFVAVAYLWIIYMFRSNKTAVLISSASVSVLYCLWGIIHHALEGRLNKTLVLEYASFALLTFVLLAFALSV